MSSAPSNSNDCSRMIAHLRERLSGCARAERRSLGRWLKRVETIRRSGRPVDRSLQKIEKSLQRAEKSRRLRAEAIDRPYTYPEELPVSARRAEIRRVWCLAHPALPLAEAQPRDPHKLGYKKTPVGLAKILFHSSSCFDFSRPRKK